MAVYQMKHKELLEKLTLQEKASLLSGKDFWHSMDIERLGIPSVMLADGPHGIRKQAGSADHLGLNASLPATCYPTAATMANSWDTELAEELGGFLGEEAACQGVGVLLGPGLNIKRSPLCGRNFEYFSEDPYLSGKMAAAYVRGIQKNGVSACPKHFAANSQELRRLSVDSVMDERTLREIYLTGFEIVVKEGKPKTIMTSYNKVNGTYANENEHLLQDILYGEWGHQGIAVTDWGGSNDHVRGVAAGSHLEMPATSVDGVLQIVHAVETGALSEELLNRRVDEFLDVILPLYRTVSEKAGTEFNVEDHHRMAEKAAESCIVLLKNENGLLPLKAGTRVAVIGDFAEQPRYQGAGSSMVNPTKLSKTLELLAESGLDCQGYAKGFLRNGKADEGLLKEAVELAKKADVVLLYMGLEEQRESEGQDRQDMKIAENQVRVLEEVSRVNPRVAVILAAGAPVEMDWDRNAMAVVHGYLSGQAGARAILRALNGSVCPSGRLAETYPVAYEDTPAFHYYPGKEKTCEYREGLYVGYRYYDTAGVEVKYPFGYGLSYTTFDYSELEVSEKQVSLRITNTGAVDGAEVVQIYIGKKGQTGVYRPKKELKAFQKVFLKAGESQRITIGLDDKAFRCFDVRTNRWQTERGTYEIMAAANVEDVRLKGEIFLEGTAQEPESGAEDVLPSYRSGHIKQVPDAEFAELLGRPIPNGHFVAGEKLDINSPLCQMKYAKSRAARLIFRVLDWMMRKNEKAEKPDLNILFIYNIPFRGIAKMMGGAVSMKMAQAMCDMANGEFFGGLWRLAGGFLENRKARKSAGR